MSFLIKIIVFAAALTSLCFAAKAEERPPLVLNSFEQLWKMAAAQNPTLETYKLNIEIARYNHRASVSYLWPDISATATAQDNFTIPTTVLSSSQLGQTSSEELALRMGTKYNYAGAVTLQYALFDWQKVVAGRQARNYVKLRQVEEIYYLQTLRNQTASLYFQTLVSLKALEINKQDLAFADALVNIAQKKYGEGALALIDLNQARINYNQVKQNTIISENLYESNLHQLRILLGLSADFPIVFNEKLPVTSYDGLSGLGEDKLLATYVYLAKDASYALRNQKAANLPKLTLNFYMGADQFQKTFPSFSFKRENWYGQQYMGLSLTQSIFTGFGNSNRIRSARTSVALAEKQLDIATEQSRITDHLLLGEIQRKYAAVLNSLKTFELYGENLRMYNIQYEEGAVDLNTFLIYFQDYLIAENAYLSQLSDYYNDLSVMISRN